MFVRLVINAIELNFFVAGYRWGAGTMTPLILSKHLGNAEGGGNNLLSAGQDQSGRGKICVPKLNRNQFKSKVGKVKTAVD
jgi:hypothetical protein